MTHCHKAGILKSPHVKTEMFIINPYQFGKSEITLELDQSHEDYQCYSDLFDLHILSLN
jgi:hypothetical protein